MTYLEHTLSNKILPKNRIHLVTKRKFDIQARLTDELISERYVLNLDKSSAISVDSHLISSSMVITLFPIYPHTIIIKDKNGKFFSSDFSRRLVNVQIEELIHNDYLINLNSLKTEPE